ncbi:hypothetical protein SKAU_G00408200 [Synaphobranchus kaupii]|uniref:Transmembrane protein n=1 Tax=Synaphobranchus kaupii TaxID=118154 RepID=A0A9Q1EAG7_SYNKA|nr:hypothetical protein SKAU_G00408200 [Synaphobranchus kaupii]
MSLTMTKAGDITVFTVTSDSGSRWPMVCQLFTYLCCSPMCAVSGRLRKLMAGTQSTLATVQIMAGLLTIGLGAVLMSVYFGPYSLVYIGAHYWSGTIFIISGLFCIFAERFSSTCSVSTAVAVNLVSAALAVTAIVLYAVDDGPRLADVCMPGNPDNHDLDGDYGVRHAVTVTAKERDAGDSNLQLCQMYKSALLPIVIGLKVLLVASAALQISVNISVAVLYIKALMKNSEGEQVTEAHQPLTVEARHRWLKVVSAFVESMAPLALFLRVVNGVENSSQNGSACERNFTANFWIINQSADRLYRQKAGPDGFDKLLGALCCTPACYVSGRLRKLTVGPLSSLATVQMMMGLLTIGFGAVLMTLYDGPYFMLYIGAPYWLGASFIFSGLFTIFGERFSSPCLVFLTGTVNVASAVLAVIAIVIYSVDEGAVFDRSCLVSRQNDGYYSSYAGSYGDYRRVNLTDVERNMKDSNLQICQMYKSAILPIAKGLKVLLVASAALQLCVSISVAVLAIRALKKNSEGQQVPEDKQPLMEEVTANPVA